MNRFISRPVFVLFLLCAVCSSCRYVNRRHGSGHGRSSREDRQVTGFTGVDTRGDIDVVVSQGDYHVRVEADENILHNIETTVENGKLIIHFKDDFSISDFDNAKVYVTAPDLNSFETDGSGDVTGEGKISVKGNALVKVSGSGDIQLRLDCPDVQTETHGSGDIKLEGESKTVSCSISGSGDVHAGDLKAETVKVSVHGSGDVTVFASESLDAEIYGSGDVHYRGSPKLNSSIHGSGELQKED